MANWLMPYVEKVKNITEASQFDLCIADLYHEMKEHDYAEECCTELKEKAFYIKNRFSEEATKEKMLASREKVLNFLDRLVQTEEKNIRLETVEKYLENFYLFLEALTEYTPDKRGGAQKEDWQKMKVCNEYDLQHLLYAVLKPLYPGIRKEVALDSGIGMVRADIEIPELEMILEVKYTRESMTLKN